jgi:hypothetical protein
MLIFRCAASGELPNVVLSAFQLPGKDGGWRNMVPTDRYP